MQSLWCLYYKTLQIINVRKIDKLHTKLVSLLLSFSFTGLGKHTSSLHNFFIFSTLLTPPPLPRHIYDTSFSLQNANWARKLEFVPGKPLQPSVMWH
jgi:hypothetical protein